MDGPGLAIRWEARKSPGASSFRAKPDWFVLRVVVEGVGIGDEFGETKNQGFYIPCGERRVIPRFLAGAAEYREAPFAGLPTTVRNGLGAVGEEFSIGTHTVQELQDRRSRSGNCYYLFQVLV